MALISNSAILRPHSRTAETIRCLMKPLEFALLVSLACTSVLLGQTKSESPRFTLANTADKARVTKGADVEIVIEMTICSINRAHIRSVSGNLTRRARRKGLIRLSLFEHHHRHRPSWRGNTPAKSISTTRTVLAASRAVRVLRFALPSHVTRNTDESASDQRA